MQVKKPQLEPCTEQLAGLELGKKDAKPVYFHRLFDVYAACVRAVASVVSDALQPCDVQPSRPLCPWGSPGRSTGVGCHALLQGIFLTRGSNSGLLHSRQILNRLCYYVKCQAR